MLRTFMCYETELQQQSKHGTVSMDGWTLDVSGV